MALLRRQDASILGMGASLFVKRHKQISDEHEGFVAKSVFLKAKALPVFC